MSPELDWVNLNPISVYTLVECLKDLIMGQKFFLDFVEYDVDGQNIIQDENSYLEFGTRHPLYYLPSNEFEGRLYIRTNERKFQLIINFSKGDEFLIGEQQITIRYKNARENECILEFTNMLGKLPN